MYSNAVVNIRTSPPPKTHTLTTLHTKCHPHLDGPDQIKRGTIVISMIFEIIIINVIM